MPWCIDCLRRLPPPSPSPSPYEPPPLFIGAHGISSEPYHHVETSGASGGSMPAGGGAFGGGGSTDGWEEAPGFSASDYAAFDRTVAADRNDPRGSYDS